MEVADPKKDTQLIQVIGDCRLHFKKNWLNIDELIFIT
jgi:hypothetical protein